VQSCSAERDCGIDRQDALAELGHEAIARPMPKPGAFGGIASFASQDAHFNLEQGDSRYIKLKGAVRRHPGDNIGIGLVVADPV
jgi:hypothetical protein